MQASLTMIDYICPKSHYCIVMFLAQEASYLF